MGRQKKIMINVMINILILTILTIGKTDNIHDKIGNIVITNLKILLINENNEPLEMFKICLGNEKRICQNTNSKGVVNFNKIKLGINTIEVKDKDGKIVKQDSVFIRNKTQEILTVVVKKDKIISLDTMSVNANKYREIETRSNIITLSKNDLNSVPGTANDINRILATLPSINSMGTIDDNSIKVRGGHSLENGYQIDGVELDNINHFSRQDESGGGFSIVDADLINNIKCYPGIIPIQMATHTSSGICVNLESGLNGKNETKIGLGISGLKLSLKRSILDKIGILMSVRYLDMQLINSYSKLQGIPNNFDGLLKLNMKTNKIGSFNLLSIVSKDRYISDKKYNELDEIMKFNLTREGIQSGVGIEWELTNTVLINKMQISYSNWRNKTGKNHLGERDTLVLSEWFINRGDGENKTYSIGMNAFTEKEIGSVQVERTNYLLKDNINIYISDKINMNVCFEVKRIKNSIYNIWNQLYVEYEMPYENVETDVLTCFTEECVRKYSQKSLSYSTSYPSKKEINLVLNQGGVGTDIKYDFNKLGIVAGVKGNHYMLLRQSSISPHLQLKNNINTNRVISVGALLSYQLPPLWEMMLLDIVLIQKNKKELILRSIELQRCFQLLGGYSDIVFNKYILNINGYYKWYDKEYPFINPSERYLCIDTANSGAGYYRLKTPDGKKEAIGIEMSIRQSQIEVIHYSINLAIASLKNQYTDGNWYCDADEIGYKLSGTLGLRISKNQMISIKSNIQAGRPYHQNGDKRLPYYSKKLKMINNITIRYDVNLRLYKNRLELYVEALNILNQRQIIGQYLEPTTKQFYDRISDGIIPNVKIMYTF